jgi:3-oxoacyl-(acyl-carrier-protein) synthase
MAVIVSVGLASPLGLGREAALAAWRDGTSGLVPNDRWPTDGFPRSDAGLVQGFNPRKQLPNRKAVKLMSREAQLGVFAAVEAVGGRDVCAREGIDPARFGAYAAAGYEVSSLADHEEMLATARSEDDPRRLDVGRLFTVGRDAYNPLAPLRILPNMALFHAGVTLGLQGPHLSLGSSPAAGLFALGEAAEAIDEGDADAALVLGTDAQVEEFRSHMLVEAGIIPTLAAGEAGAALLLRAADRDGVHVLAWGAGQEPTARGYADPTDGGAARKALYDRVLDLAGVPIDACLGDLWGDPARDAAESGALPPGCPHLTTRPRTGWLGAAAGIFDAAIATAEIQAGRWNRVLVTAAGAAGDLTAVILGRAEDAHG